ncbi:MAG: GGDEF domain-containing protein [Rhodocyclaceae bacterium]|nr:GGDEF domain-containing protein [Rhodocyclaceae bacterium]
MTEGSTRPEPVLEARAEIATLLQLTPAEVRQSLAELVDACAGEIAAEFYDVMTSDESARHFLEHEVVSKRLKASMENWLRDLFVALDASRLDLLIARQIEIGEIHARIKLPPVLMQAGVRQICRSLRSRLEARGGATRSTLQAALYASDLLHLADGLMMTAYVRDVQKGARAGEAYRQVLLGHDTMLERERQRAVLSEWTSELLFAVRSSVRLRHLPRLADSEFGLWFKHKAEVLFEGAPDAAIVSDAIDQIDSVLLPKMVAGGMSENDLQSVLAELRRQLEFVRYLSGDLFDRVLSAHAGKDSVTGLMSRRHLPAVLDRVIAQHRQGDRSFGFVIAHVDEMRSQAYSEDSRNALMHQIAACLLEIARTSDHLFRYGSGEFALVCVEIGREALADTANRLRNRIFGHGFALRHDPKARASLSIGVAMYDGHPDYMQVIRRAEAALVRAVADGGNCVQWS